MSLLSREKIYRMLRRTGEEGDDVADEGYTGEWGLNVGNLKISR